MPGLQSNREKQGTLSEFPTRRHFPKRSFRSSWVLDSSEWRINCIFHWLRVGGSRTELNIESEKSQQSGSKGGIREPAAGVIRESLIEV